MKKLIPFSIEVSCDENTVTTIFNTSNSSCEFNIDPENDMASDNDVERKEDQDDERLPAVENVQSLQRNDEEDDLRR